MNSVALVRIEQLYPFPIEEYAAIIDSYPSAKVRLSGARKNRRTRARGTRSSIAFRNR